MNTLLFLEKLKSLRFDEELLRKQGFDEESIFEKQSAFFPKRNLVTSKSSDILIKFIEEYDTEFSLISNVSFNDKIEFKKKQIFIGWHNGEDPLVINSETGEIVTITYWDYNTINFYCAENSSKFMEAYLVHGIGRLDINFKTEEERWLYNLSKSKEAAKVAGGEKYFKFWKSLYPTDDGKSQNHNELGFYN